MEWGRLGLLVLLVVGRRFSWTSTLLLIMTRLSWGLLFTATLNINQMKLKEEPVLSQSLTLGWWQRVAADYLAQVHGLYYHLIALTQSQFTNFCGCGFEALVLPPLPEGVRAQVAADQHSVVLEAEEGKSPDSCPDSYSSAQGHQLHQSVWLSHSGHAVHSHSLFSVLAVIIIIIAN